MASAMKIEEIENRAKAKKMKWQNTKMKISEKKMQNNALRAKAKIMRQRNIWRKWREKMAASKRHESEKQNNESNIKRWYQALKIWRKKIKEIWHLGIKNRQNENMAKIMKAAAMARGMRETMAKNRRQRNKAGVSKRAWRRKYQKSGWRIGVWRMAVENNVAWRRQRNIGNGNGIKAKAYLKRQTA